MIVIRPALPSQAALLTGIAIRSKRTWGYDDEFMRRIMPEMIVTPEMIAEGYAAIAFDRDVPAGYLLIRMDGAQDAFLNDLFVEPASMHEGVGSALLLHAFAWARERGAQRIFLVSDPNAIGFYERRGFTRSGEVASEFVPGRTLAKMSIALSGDA